VTRDFLQQAIASAPAPVRPLGNQTDEELSELSDDELESLADGLSDKELSQLSSSAPQIPLSVGELWQLPYEVSLPAMVAGAQRARTGGSRPGAGMPTHLWFPSLPVLSDYCGCEGD